MKKLIKTLLKDNIIFLAVGVTLGIGILSLIKAPKLPAIEISHLDKIYHLIAYFVLGLFWLLSFPNSTKKSKLKYVIAIGCVIYGIVIEVFQMTLTTYRTFSLYDVLANSVGVFVALLIFNSVYKKIDAI